MKRSKTPSILYLNAEESEDRIKELEISGMKRYAGARGWRVVPVPQAEWVATGIPALLALHGPVAGCVVEATDDSADLPPALFGGIPVVYFHAEPSLLGGRLAGISTDDAAVARAAFRELALGLPAAFAAVPFKDDFVWSRVRVRTFAALAAGLGAPCSVFNPAEGASGSRAVNLARWVAALPRRTAVFAANDATAAEVVAAAREAHRAIPRELTLLGVDNQASVCEASNPTISSIQLDHELGGYKIARLLGETIAGRAAGEGAVSIGPLMAVRRASTGGSGRREKFILDAVEMIRHEAYDCDFSVERLAARFPCSRQLFRLRFREATGHSALDEIQHVRLERVHILLSQTDTAIGAIAGLCGYRSDFALKWIFKKRTGMSMREWRARNRR